MCNWTKGGWTKRHPPTRSESVSVGFAPSPSGTALPQIGQRINTRQVRMRRLMDHESSGDGVPRPQVFLEEDSTCISEPHFLYGWLDTCSGNNSLRWLSVHDSTSPSIHVVPCTVPGEILHTKSVQHKHTTTSASISKPNTNLAAAQHHLFRLFLLSALRRIEAQVG